MAESESWRALMRGPARARVAMVTLCIAVHAMDVFVTATVLPSVVADIGGTAFYAWPTAIYVVTAIMGTASGGHKTRRRGHIKQVRAIAAGADDIHHVLGV